MMDTERKRKLLLVEDDRDLSLITAMQLEKKGYEVLCALTGEKAIALLMEEDIDLVLLDIMLPDYEGHELCHVMRTSLCGYQGPIIFMSCLGDSANIVDAFREGGNDYLVKPVDMQELVERIEQNLQKNERKEAGGARRWFRQFMVDESRCEVYRVENRKLCGKIELSPIEYKLLLSFIERPDEVMLYRQLYQKVWEQDDIGDYRSLMVHVSNLRRKIDYAKTEVVRAVRSTGYLFQDV